MSSQTPIFHLILPDLKLDIIWGSSPEFRFVRDNIQNFYFALPKAAHILQPDGPNRPFMSEMIYDSTCHSIWAGAELTYQNSHLGSSLKNISDILFLGRRLEYYQGPEDLCFHFSLRIFYEVPQRHNNEGWTLQSREIVYGWLRPVLRLGLKVFVGKTEAIFKILGWERIKSFFPWEL